MRRRALLALFAATVACGNILAKSEDDSAPTNSDGGTDGGGDGSFPPEGETTIVVDSKVIDDGGLDGPTVEGGVVGGSTKCASTRGPAMVELSMGGVTYCIDTTEVTNAQYQPFIDEPNKPPKHPRCTWNTNVAPNCSDDNTKGANDPVNCIDWCDAWLFCSWAGKRLCGKIGGAPLENAYADRNNATKSQWFAACSNGGTQDYCYGTTAKNVCTANNAPPAAVMSHPDCTGPFAGLFDLTGNLGEWEDSCVEDPLRAQDDRCLRRGGDLQDIPADQRCSQEYQLGRAARERSGGFRCCRD